MKIQAEIITHYKDILHLDQGEESEWLDEITLKILSPNDLEGHKITIFLDVDLIEDNPWNQVGTIINFEYEDSIYDFIIFHIFTIYNALYNLV